MFTKILCISLLAIMGIVIICLVGVVFYFKAICDTLIEENRRFYENYNTTRNTFHEAIQIFRQALESKGDNK